MLYLVTGRALLPRPSSSTKENKVCVSFSRASLIFTICLPLSFNPFSFSLLFFLFLFFVVSFFLPSCFIARWWPPRSTLLWKFCANFFYFFIIILSLLVHKVGRERKLFKDRRKKWSFLFSCFLTIFYHTPFYAHRVMFFLVTQRMMKEERDTKLFKATKARRGSRQPFRSSFLRELFFLTAFYHVMIHHIEFCSIFLLSSTLLLSSFLFYHFFSSCSHLHVYDEII